MITFDEFKRSILSGEAVISWEEFSAAGKMARFYDGLKPEDVRRGFFPSGSAMEEYYYTTLIEGVDALLYAWYNASFVGCASTAFQVPASPIVDRVIKNKPYMIGFIRSFFNTEMQLCSGRRGFSFRRVVHDLLYAGKVFSDLRIPSVFNDGVLCFTKIVSTMRTSTGKISVFSPITYAALLSRSAGFAVTAPRSLLCPTASWGTPVIAANALGYEKLGIVDVIPAVIDKLPKLLDRLNKGRQPSLFGGNPNMALDSFCIPSERMLDEVTGIYDQVFFCPPYFDLELYGGGEQSTESFPTYEEWLEGYWRKTVENCFDAMKEGGAFSFVMSNKLNGCYIGPDMLDIAEDYFRHCDAVRVVPNKLKVHDYSERYETCYTLIKEEY